MPKKKTTRKKPGPDYIHEGLWPLAVDLAEIQVDPRNARLHDQRNISAIAASLRQFGQVKPIVVNRATKIIEAGNGTYQAAASLDWTQLAVVWVDHDPASAVGFSVADNRTAELATWDDALLGELIDQIQDTTPDLAAELMLDELRQQASADSDGEGDAAGGSAPDTWQVVVNCKSESDQKRLHKRLETEGRTCRLLTL